MVDIEPSAEISRFTPRDTTLVDAVAEAKRIAEQQMRSNPLKDARIDAGLTQWVGNYGGSLVWIGEITPPDQNLVDAYGNLRPQRGFVLQRDDPGGHFAYTMYDSSPSAGQPLQQTVIMYDVNGQFTYRESSQGGLAFPDRPIVMYPRVNIEAGMTNVTDDMPWAGSGNHTATRLQFQGGWAASGVVTVSTYVRVTGVGGTVVNSPTRVLVGANAIDELIDISAIYNNGEDFIDVQWHTWRSAGTGSYFPRPTRVRSYSL